MSLNYINKDIADSYQMSKIKKKVGEKNGKNKNDLSVMRSFKMNDMITRALDDENKKTV